MLTWLHRIIMNVVAKNPDNAGLGYCWLQCHKGCCWSYFPNSSNCCKTSKQNEVHFLTLCISCSPGKSSDWKKLTKKGFTCKMVLGPRLRSFTNGKFTYWDVLWDSQVTCVILYFAGLSFALWNLHCSWPQQHLPQIVTIRRICTTLQNTLRVSIHCRWGRGVLWCWAKGPFTGSWNKCSVQKSSFVKVFTQQCSRNGPRQFRLSSRMLSYLHIWGWLDKSQHSLYLLPTRAWD